MSSFTCTLCNKSYSRHPEYEAHISSYDHQHRKRLQDLKQLSRDPNAAEKARRAEKKADAEAGLRVIDTTQNRPAPGPGPGSISGGVGKGSGFKKGGFKSSFTAVKGTAAPAAPVKKNVLGDDDDGVEAIRTNVDYQVKPDKHTAVEDNDGESDTDEDYADDRVGGGYYDPRKPTDCFATCTGIKKVDATAL